MKEKNKILLLVTMVVTIVVLVFFYRSNDLLKGQIELKPTKKVCIGLLSTTTHPENIDQEDLLFCQQNYPELLRK
ncbi:MAG: hypothetical protein AAB373_02255 [Patescibacteria group bacterium]